MNFASVIWLKAGTLAVAINAAVNINFITLFCIHPVVARTDLNDERDVELCCGLHLAFDKLFGLLDLCLGCCSEMPGGAENVVEMIEHFGPRGKILYVHFRDVKGTVPSFAECFIGEGNYNAAETLRLLRDSGFTGFLLDDHVPHVVDDSNWNHRGRAHAIGYMQGLMDVLAPDVVSVADGGGKVRGAARRPVIGAERLAP